MSNHTKIPNKKSVSQTSPRLLVLLALLAMSVIALAAILTMQFDTRQQAREVGTDGGPNVKTRKSGSAGKTAKNKATPSDSPSDTNDSASFATMVCPGLEATYIDQCYCLAKSCFAHTVDSTVYVVPLQQLEDENFKITRNSDGTIAINVRLQAEAELGGDAAFAAFDKSSGNFEQVKKKAKSYGLKKITSEF